MMQGLPKSVTILGVVLAVAAVLADAGLLPIVSQLVGEHVAVKIAAAGALIASIGRAVQEQLVPPPAAPPLEPDDVP